MIFSVPEDYKILNKLRFGDLVEEKMRNVRKKGTANSSNSNTEEDDEGVSSSSTSKTSHVATTKRIQMTPKFANVLKSVAIEFAAMLSEGSNHSNV